MTDRTLKSVDPSQVAPKRPAGRPGRPKSMTAAARTNSRLELQVAMRDDLAKRLASGEVSDRDVVPMQKWLDSIQQSIEQGMGNPRNSGHSGAEDVPFDVSAV